MRTTSTLMAILIGLATAGVVYHLCGSKAYAQQAAGASANLTGQVKDVSGAVIPNVQLTLQSTVGGAPLSTVSNSDGYYGFSLVAPGVYTLTAKKMGFSIVVIPGIVLSVQRTSSVNITMSPGKVVQKVTVSAAAAALQTQTSSLSGVVSGDLETAIPLPYNDPTELVDLVAGVTNDNRTYLVGSTGNAGGLSYQGRESFNVNGGQRSTSVAMVDGVDVSVDAGDFLSDAVVPSSDFTQELTVQTNDESANFGRGQAVLNIITKSGTNGFHGSAFEYLQNNALNANNLFANTAGVAIPHLERNEYGVALGGPVIIPHVYNGRNKTFWFFNLDRMKQLTGTTVSERVPTAAELNGDFAGDYTTGGVQVPLYNPNSITVNPTTGVPTRSEFPGDIIPSSMIQSYGVNLAKYLPAPNNPGVRGVGNVFTGESDWIASANAPLDFNRLDVKVDEEASPKNHFMFRYSKFLYQAYPVDFYNNVANPDSLSSRLNPQPGMDVAATWTATVSPTLVINQAINVARYTDDSIEPAFDPTPLGGPFASGAIAAFETKYDEETTFPNVSIGGYAPLGNGQGNMYVEPFGNYGYQFGLVKMHGAHTISAGFQAEYLMGSTSSYDQPAYLGYGGFTCGPDPLICATNTGNGLADLELGIPSGGSVVDGFGNYLTSKYLAWYGGDDWRITPKLTVNLGLRYDFTTPAVARHSEWDEFNPSASNPVGTDIGPNTRGASLNQFLGENYGVGPLTGVVVFPNSPLSQGPGIEPTDYGDIAPRLGLAYSITPKLVLRMGVARLYTVSAVAPGAFGNSGGPYDTVTDVVATTNGYTPIITPNNVFPSGFVSPLGDSQGESTLVGNSMAIPTTTAQWNPYFDQENIGFEYQLPGDAVLSVAYAGSQGSRLECAHDGCADQIPPNLIAKYGSSEFNVVPNPFYGIVTNPSYPLSQPTVTLENLLYQWPEFDRYSEPWAFGGLQANHDTFYSNFNALEVQYTKHFSHGLSVMAAFTWSKALSNADNMDSGYLGESVGYQQMVNFNAEYSMESDDVPKRLVIGHVYELPFGHGQHFGSSWSPTVNEIFGGWEFSGISTFQSGYPMGISAAGYTTGAGSGNARPNMVGPPTSACVSGYSRGEQIAGHTLNPAAFSLPQNFTFGNAARTLPCLQDGVKDADWSLMKTFPIHESANLEFRADFFNLFNRPQLGTPDTTFNSSGFGTITSQYNSPRVIQFGLKFNW